MAIPDSQRDIPSARPRGARSYRALAWLRLLGVVLSVIAMLPIYMMLRVFRRSPAARYTMGAVWTRRWFRVLTRLFGWTVRVHGEPLPSSCFVAPNHIGYADIMVMSVASGCFFVSKVEVVSWPVIGKLLLMTEHLTVSRSMARDLAHTVERVRERLVHGHRVCVFLEGTTTAGDRVLKFLTPLVKPAVASGAPIVPASIHWSCPDPNFDLSDDAAYWTADHTFGPHFMKMVGIPRMSADVTFGAPIESSSLPRRELADAVRAEVVRLYKPALDADSPAAEASWIKEPSKRAAEE